MIRSRRRCYSRRNKGLKIFFMCCFIKIVTSFIVRRWVVLLDEKYKEGIFSFLKLSNNFVKEFISVAWNSLEIATTVTSSS